MGTADPPREKLVKLERGIRHSGQESRIVIDPNENLDALLKSRRIQE